MTGTGVIVTALIVAGVQKIGRRFTPPIVRVIPSSKRAQLLSWQLQPWSDDTIDSISDAADLCAARRDRDLMRERTGDRRDSNASRTRCGMPVVAVVSGQ